MLSAFRRLRQKFYHAAGFCPRFNFLAPTAPLEKEFLDRYRPGLYPPVELGDIFDNHYRVVRKLGWGLQSTVWLANNTNINGRVALKILIAAAFNENGVPNPSLSRIRFCTTSTMSVRITPDTSTFQSFLTVLTTEDPMEPIGVSFSMS